MIIRLKCIIWFENHFGLSERINSPVQVMFALFFIKLRKYAFVTRIVVKTNTRRTGKIKQQLDSAPILHRS